MKTVLIIMLLHNLKSIENAHNKIDFVFLDHFSSTQKQDHFNNVKTYVL